MIRLKCLIFGHDLIFAQWISPIPTGFGFMHYGEFSSCNCCGKQVHLNDGHGLPLLIPKNLEEENHRAYLRATIADRFSQEFKICVHQES